MYPKATASTSGHSQRLSANNNPRRTYIVVPRCYFVQSKGLKSKGLRMEPDERCSLVFTDDKLRIDRNGNHGPSFDVPYRNLTTLEIGGSTTNGRFIGGGFGIEGAAEGMLMAGALNALTTRHRTAVALRTKDGVEIVLLTKREAPQELQGRLAPIRRVLQVMQGEIDD